MGQKPKRMHIAVKDRVLQSRIQKVMADQEITHEQLLNKYLKLPLEGDLTGLNEKYEMFTRLLKKYIVSSKDINRMDLLMSHIWVIIANTTKGVYDAAKVSDTILNSIDNGDWIKEINTEEAWNELNKRDK